MTTTAQWPGCPIDAQRGDAPEEPQSQLLQRGLSYLYDPIYTLSAAELRCLPSRIVYRLGHHFKGGT